MGLYKQQGSKVWWMSFSHRGKQIRKPTGTANKKLAEEIYCKIKTQMVEGNHFDFPKERDKTLEELLSRYLEEVTPDKKPGTQRDDRSYAVKLARFFGDRFLNEITPDLVTQYKLERKKTVGPCSVNRELSLLSAAFNQAIRIWGWCKYNPVSAVPRDKEPKRVRYFSEKEFQEIYDLLPDWVKPIVLLAKNTGLRLSNAVNLRSAQVNLKKRLIVLEAEEMKNSQTLGVPVNDNAYAVLKDRVHSKYVFCRKDGKPYTTWGVSQSFKRACQKAGYPDYRFHDLRHDFCSKLVQAGIDLYTVKELAGHKDITTTQRYAHLSPGRLHDAVSVLDLS